MKGELYRTKMREIGDHKIYFAYFKETNRTDLGFYRVDPVVGDRQFSNMFASAWADFPVTAQKIADEEIEKVTEANIQGYFESEKKEAKLGEIFERMAKHILEVGEIA